MTAVYTLGKEERLKSSLSIHKLLKTGNSVSEYPFKIYWSISSDIQQKFPARIAISVPRRKFKRAVDRNLMKRRVREAYRQNKNIIYTPVQNKETKIIMLVLFLSDEFLSFTVLNTKMIDLLNKLANKLSD